MSQFSSGWAAGIQNSGYEDMLPHVVDICAYHMYMWICIDDMTSATTLMAQGTRRKCMDPLRGFVLAKDPTIVFLVPRFAAGLFAFTVVAEPGTTGPDLG